jgi:hypothetical protein
VFGGDGRQCGRREQHDPKVGTWGRARHRCRRASWSPAGRRQYVGLRRCPLSGRRATAIRPRCARSAR